MARKSDLPSAEAFFTDVCVRQGRAPWRALGVAELCECLNVHGQTAYNWQVRGVAPEAEHDPRRTYRACGSRVLYRYEAVLDFLDDGDQPRAPWFWTRRL